MFTTCGAVAAIVDFEPPPPIGTSYGHAFGQTPAQTIPELGQDGIGVSFQEFVDSSISFTGFVEAEIGGRFAAGFPTTPLSLDTISARFDFAGVGFNVTQASFEYLDLGIHYNLAVNDGTLREFGAFTELPANPETGISLALEELDPGTGRMRLTLTGDVNSFLIGGYELAIDNVVAVPEPATLVLLGVCAAFLGWRGSRRRTQSAH